MVSTTAPMSFNPARRAWIAIGRIEDRRRHRLVVAHRREAAERRAGFVNGIVAARKPVPLENFVQHERPAGVGDVGHERSPAQIGDALDVRLHEQMIEAVVAAGDDNGVDFAASPAPRIGRRRRGRSGSGPRPGPRAAPAEFGAGFNSTSRPRLRKKSQRLRREQRQRLRAGKHHDGELGRSAGHRRGKVDSRRKRTFVPSGVRRESYPAWWMAWAWSRGCSGVSSSHHSARLARAADRSRGSPRSPHRSG